MKKNEDKMFLLIREETFLKLRQKFSRVFIEMILILIF